LNIIAEKVLSISLAVVLVLAGAYVLLVAFFSIFQSRLIYFPHREIDITPDEIGLSYKDVYFETADRVKLSGWFIPVENSRGVILLCHGNAGNISHRLDSIQKFHRLRLSTFIFDYRGYGKSDGKPTEQGTYLDAEAAWSYLVMEEKVSPNDIIVLGRSIGGAVAGWLAQNHTVKAIILESTFTSIRDLGAELYPYLPVRLLSRFDYNAAQYISKVNCPVLIIHSRDDEIVPFTHGQQLFEAAVEHKDFLEIKGTHNEGFIIDAAQYENGLDSFIRKCAGK
jgi:fermentation-respiration switch protein FrsA (DUF1100 family)